MSAYISVDLKTQIKETDRNRSAYCLTSEPNSGIPLTYDHIYPRNKGGRTEYENLCLACRPCNEFKRSTIEAIDPISGVQIPLYNPRTQLWTDQFEWSWDDVQIIGLTPIGRTTVVALQMNNPTIITTRSRWVIAGWHPPE